MRSILFYLTYPLIWLVAWLPLRMLYLLSDISYFFLRYILHYRRKVVDTNLANSFPDKSVKERRKIANAYFRTLCDNGVESIKMLHISEKEMKRRYIFTNVDLILDLAKQGHNMTGLFGHYANWEWMASLPLWTNNLMTVATLYKPLSNPYFDKLFLKIRTRFGTRCIAKHNTLRAMLEMQKQDHPYILAFIADQTPTRHNLHFWTQFLNQDTPFLTGWETLSSKLHNSVIYVDLRRKRRGYYEITMQLMEVDASHCKPFELTEQYARCLEQSIIKEPQYWLWSHRRWKHKHIIES